MTDLMLQIIISAVILPLLAWGVSKFTQYLDSKILLNKNENLQKLLFNATDELERAVNLAVTEVGEVFVKEIKKDGVFGAKEARVASDMALEKTKAIMSDASMNVLTTAKVDIEAMVKALIEENVVVEKVS